MKKVLLLYISNSESEEEDCLNMANAYFKSYIESRTKNQVSCQNIFLSEEEKVPYQTKYLENLLLSTDEIFKSEIEKAKK